MSHTWHHSTADSRSSPLGHYARINENREKLWQRNLLSSLFLWDVVRCITGGDTAWSKYKGPLAPNPQSKSQSHFQTKTAIKMGLVVHILSPTVTVQCPEPAASPKTSKQNLHWNKKWGEGKEVQIFHFNLLLDHRHSRGLCRSAFR